MGDIGAMSRELNLPGLAVCVLVVGGLIWLTLWNMRKHK